jgi:hypothetical protein
MTTKFSIDTLKGAAVECRRRASDYLAEAVEAENDKSGAQWLERAAKLERAAEDYDGMAQSGTYDPPLVGKGDMDGC